MKMNDLSGILLVDNVLIDEGKISLESVTISPREVKFWRDGERFGLTLALSPLGRSTKSRPRAFPGIRRSASGWSGTKGDM